ncbi:MAG TPA: DUF2977 domain-containing protein [Staphylococcus ureilyticus]|uniref:DUF2977 domain-containing protein n=1 Tax=Staphylococcus ureilyticus TaxID=94138 RepID=UPI001D8F7DBD|nr:DUF2977 domain-containing protein [Staphylococcus ureilyticus]HJG66635.1 DUF2977 domain-containing protein [Staphylococcus ureilyticus]
MIVSINEHNEIMGYASVGSIDNGIEVSDDYQYLFENFEPYKLMINERKEVYINPNFDNIEIPNENEVEEITKNDVETLAEAVKLLSKQVAELNIKVEGLIKNA